MKSQTLILVAFLIVSVGVDVQALFGGRLIQTTDFSWNVEVEESGTLIPQNATVVGTRRLNMTFVETFDGDNMTANNFTASTVLVDSSRRVAIKLKTSSSPCYLGGTGTAYDDLVGLLSSYNGTVVTMSPNVTGLNGTGPAKSFWESIRTYLATPSLFTLCWRSRLVELLPITRDPTGDDTVMETTMVYLDERVVIIEPNTSSRQNRLAPQLERGGWRPGVERLGVVDFPLPKIGGLRFLLQRGKIQL